MERSALSFAEKWTALARTIGPYSRLRIAPTPSGFLHLGNAVNFVLNWLTARLHPQARLLVRIDDLDAERKRPEYVQNIFDTLRNLGLDWDEGPRSPEDLERQWAQHLRLPLYEKLLQTLRQRGHLFACAKSRRELAPFGGDYPEAFRHQPYGLDDVDVAWRIRTPLPHQPEIMPPDFVVRRRDGIPAYQTASVADDVFFGITHVIRGQDLWPSTRAQQYLAQCAGLTAFERIAFLHHPLLTDECGRKLSKSAGAPPLSTGPANGTSPAAVFAIVARWLALEGPAKSAADLLAAARQKLLATDE